MRKSLQTSNLWIFRISILLWRIIYKENEICYVHTYPKSCIKNDDSKLTHYGLSSEIANKKYINVILTYSNGFENLKVHKFSRLKMKYCVNVTLVFNELR